VHCLMARLLRRRAPVIMDATNLLRRHREAVYGIAGECGVPLLVLRIVAPPQVVRRRLERRSAAGGGQDYPTAPWEVYLRMRGVAEPICRQHHVIDTAHDLGPAIDRFVAVVKGAVAQEERKR
ncbi:MAG: AAA family ATPase, partial [Dehalococcoidia bacterium]